MDLHYVYFAQRCFKSTPKNSSILHLAFLAVQAAFEGPGRKGRAQTEQESELSGAEHKAHPTNRSCVVRNGSTITNTNRNIEYIILMWK